MTLPLDDILDAPLEYRWFSRERHQHVLTLLAAQREPITEATLSYVFKLHYADGRSRGKMKGITLKCDREVVETVQMWLQHRGDAAFDRRDHLLLEHGIKAAWNLYDKSLACAWHALWRPGQKSTAALQAEDLRFAQLAAGHFDDQVAALLASGKPPADFSHDELKLVAWVRQQGTVRSVLFTHRPTGHVWVALRQHEGDVVHVFDGQVFAPAPLAHDTFAEDDRAYVAEATQCDERAVGWSGKHTYRVVQRYGRHILLMLSKFFADRDQAEMTDNIWFSAPDEATAILYFAEMAVHPKRYKTVPPWGGPKHGSVMRSFSLGGAPRGVWGAQWVTGFTDAKPFQAFDSEAEAIEALAAWELAQMKEGDVLDNFCLRQPSQKV